MAPQGRVIAVVDDDLEFIRFANVALGFDGYAAATFRTVAAARDYINYQPPSLVIIDYCLPDGDGLSLLRELRRRPATRVLPVILTTAMTGPQVLRLATECRALQALLLLKPYDVETLSSAVARVLGTPTSLT